MIGALWQDLRYGMRSLARTPTFTLSAVLTLALGIGACTTIFGLFEAVVLRTLPVDRPEQLYFVAHGAAQDSSGIGSNYPYFDRVRSLSRELTGVTAYRSRNDIKVALAGPAELTQGQFVSGNYHGVLGVPMRLGRGFTAEDDRAPDAASMVVISEGFWTRRFGRDPAVLGRTLTVNGRQVTIVGVTEAGFEGMEPGAPMDVTLPIAFLALEERGFLTMQDSWIDLRIVARLAEGVTAEQARTAVDGVFQQYFSEPEQSWLKEGGGRRAFANAWLRPASSGNDDLREAYAKSLVVLLSMVGVLLLIACANVANLLLARAGVRSREVALRLSIGANRARVVRQLLVESLELSVLAGAVGLLLARGGLGAISALLALGENPILLNVQPNAIVLAFTIGVSLLTGVSFGLAPAFRVTGVDLTNALKSPSASGKRLRRGLSSSQALVSGQIALCVLLVAAAGLLARTLFSLETRDGGFQRDNVLMFTADVDGTPFPAEQMPRFCDDLIDRLTNRFGLLAGSCSTSVPVNTRGNARPLAVPGAPQRSLEDSLVFMNRISPAYFRAHGIGVAEGRAFSLEDVQGSERVAVISRSAARAFFGEASPLGRRVHFRDAEELMTIVGVVEDATQWSLRDDPFRTVYTPLTQLLEPEATLIVSLRTSGDPRELAADVRAEVAALDSDVIVDYVRTMDEQIAGTLVRERVLAMISSAFGLLALILSCVGLYGVIAYDVSRRARDLGIRIALGGQRADMLGRVLGSAAAVSGLGVVIGLIATLAALRALPDEMVSDLLFEIDPRDPLTLGGAVVLIVATSLLASYLPARRASGIDPATVLRTE